ncbi:class II aldolase/adducin family protein [Herpetosiphon llansteffanensis]|uniref:class II aldolase/adducin family protein n=1 Tax=Herpetosiphon llansteffanensis TaxID=2094568 RepID=UPI000D7C2DFE|nr:class II aldolase/adducin family protein [Herpetosiphon llansteffanensis]
MNLAQEQQYRLEMVQIGRWLYERGWTPSYSGNYSVLLDEQRILTTPTGYCKGLLQPADLIIVDRQGVPLDPQTPLPSSELLMHLAVYAERPDVRACVHAHPPRTIACSIAGVELTQPLLEDIILTLGKIPTVPYARTGTAALGEAIKPFIRDHDALVLDHHGSLTVASSLTKAFHRTEQVEQAATIIATALSIGRLQPLAAEHVADLLAVRRARGGNPKAEPELPSV